MLKNTTARIYEKIFELLKNHPEGLRWSELIAKIKAEEPGLHPKTVNGCIWKLVKKYPDKVYKPSRGLFRLLKYKSAKQQNSQLQKPSLIIPVFKDK